VIVLGLELISALKSRRSTRPVASVFLLLLERFFELCATREASKTLACGKTLSEFSASFTKASTLVRAFIWRFPTRDGHTNLLKTFAAYFFTRSSNKSPNRPVSLSSFFRSMSTGFLGHQTRVALPPAWPVPPP
jgi:hypothetical protein